MKWFGRKKKKDGQKAQSGEQPGGADNQITNASRNSEQASDKPAEQSTQSSDPTDQPVKSNEQSAQPSDQPAQPVEQPAPSQEQTQNVSAQNASDQAVQSEAQISRSTVDMEQQEERLPRKLEGRMKTIEDILQTDDLNKLDHRQQGYVCYYLTTVVDQQRFNEEIANQISDWLQQPHLWSAIFPHAQLRSTTKDVITGLLDGDVILLHDKLPGAAIAIAIRSIKTRAVERPEIEKIIHGPQESLTEDLETNIGLARRWLRDPNFVVRFFEIGERSKLKVAVCYIHDIVNPEWVHEIEQKLAGIKVDRIVGQKEVMDFVVGKTSTPFPMYELTELPARLANNLTNGRIALIIEGTPVSVILPNPLINMYRGNEYVFQGNVIPFFVRNIRLIATLLALYAPAIYVALVSVNSAIIPTETGVVMATDQLGIPYPTIIETLLIMIVLDIFIEATVHVPGMIGPALNIVGSLIIGQAAAEANLTSHVVVIVTAITAVGTYVSLFQLSLAIRIWKYPLIIAAGMLGLFGIVGCSIFLLAHLCGIKSLGVPYLSPFGPLNWKDIFNGGIWDRNYSAAKRRQRIYEPRDKQRQGG